MPDPEQSALGEPLDIEQDPRSIPPTNGGSSAIRGGGHPLPPPNLAQAPYNQAQAHDQARQTISYVLLTIFVVVVLLLAAFPLIYLLDVNPSNTFDEKRSAFVIQILNIVIGPLVALIGSAMGFYFGSREKQG